MAQVVSGFLLTHDPSIGTVPEMSVVEGREDCMQTFETIARRLCELEIDTVVLVCDISNTLDGRCGLPMVMIGVGDIYGPQEPWSEIPQQSIENNEMLAVHIMSYGLEKGVDWVVSTSLAVDHAFMVPYHFCFSKQGNIRVIPIYINSGVAPFIPSRRANEIGRFVGDAIKNWAGKERVAIIGTGSVSHWPDTKQIGRLNEAWGKEVFDMTLKGDAHGLLSLEDQDILEQGGEGGVEIKNWIFAMAACGSSKGGSIVYESVRGWAPGCAFVELKPQV